MFNVKIETLEDMRNFCAIIAKTEMVPKAYRGKPDDIMVAGSMGSRLGMDVFQAMQSIASINGVPSLYGDAALSMVRSSGLLAEFREWLELDGQVVTEMPNLIEAAEKGHRIVQWCKARRQGMAEPRITTYSVTDAKLAKLWLKKGYNGQDTPWCTSPGRMLTFRARGFCLRDEFGDVLKGFPLAEEVQDYDVDMTASSDGTYHATTVADPAKPPAKLSEALKASAVDLGVGLQASPIPPSPPAEPDPASAEAPAGPPQEEPPKEEPPKTAAGSVSPEQQLVQIQDTLSQLSKTPKGSALANGLRKTFKLKGVELWPSDPAHYGLYLTELRQALLKVQGAT